MSSKIASLLSLILGLILFIPSIYAFIREYIYYKNNNWNFEEIPKKWKIKPSSDEYGFWDKEKKIKGINRFIVYFIVAVIGIVFILDGLFGI